MRAMKRMISLTVLVILTYALVNNTKFEVLSADTVIIQEAGNDSSHGREYDTEIIPGDVNSDGEVNAKDVTQLRRYLAGGWNVGIDREASDVNPDGEINAKDVTLLRRFLAGGWGIVLSDNNQNESMTSDESAKDSDRIIIKDSLSAEGICINSNHFTYYYLRNSDKDKLEIPEALCEDTQIIVTGFDFPQFKIISGDALRIDSYGNFSPAQDYFGKTKSGTAVVQVVCGKYIFEVTVDVINYADFFVYKTVDDYIGEHITEEMTTYEKVAEGCKFVAGYDYGQAASMYSMILLGYGDCWAATDTICYFCEKLGIPAIPHSAPNEISYTHYNVLVQIDGTNYIAEAGYDGKAPRYYSLQKLEEYMELPDGTLSLNSFTGWDMEAFDIPMEYDGKMVTQIGEEAFAYCEHLKYVGIPDTITEIGKKAFFESGITSVDIPASVRKIGEQAFSECNALKSVNMLCNAELGYSVFYSCDNLEEFIFPAEICRIELGMFADCYNYRNIILPDSVTYIESQAFRAYLPCKRNIFIPESIENIHEDAFWSTMEGLTVYGMAGSFAEEFALDNNIPFKAVNSTTEMPAYTDEDIVPTHGSCGEEIVWELNKDTGTLVISGQGPMYDYKNYSEQPWVDGREYIKKVIINPGVTRIGANAFMYCNSMNEIEIPESLKSIGKHALWDTKVSKILLPNAFECADFAAFMCSGMKMIEIPEGAIVGPFAFDSSEKLVYSKIYDGTGVISYNTFSDCINLSWVDIPESVYYIDDYAFSGCHGLSGVEFSVNLKMIDCGAFYQCPNLKYVVIPSNIEFIGEFAFGYKEYNTETHTGTLYDDFIIYGAKGTAAEDYARKNSIRFVEI